MREKKHTPEPWKVLPLSEAINPFIVASEETGVSIADCHCPIGGNNEANARRIVACVNACAGIETDYLETLVRESSSIHHEMMQRIQNKTAAEKARARAEQQRDELLAVLVNSRNALESANEMGDGPIVDTIWYSPHETLFDYMDSAIAGLQGGAK